MLRYEISSILFGMVWGIYYALTRVYYIKNFGNDLTIILSMEYFAMFSSIIFVRFLKYYKYLIPIVCMLPFSFFLIPFFKEKYLYVSSIFLISISYAIAYPMMLKVLNNFYPRFLVLATIGFSLGSILMGFVSKIFGYALNFFLIGILLFLSYSMILSLYRYGWERISYSAKNFKSIALILIVALSSVAIEIVYAYSSYRLHEILSDEFLYGIFYGGISSTILLMLRNHVQKIYSSKNPKDIAIKVFLLYTSYLILISSISGIFLVILWQIPMYPFYEAALLSFIIYVIKNKEYSSSIILTGYGLAGFIFLLIYNFLNISSSIMILLVLALMLVSMFLVKVLKEMKNVFRIKVKEFHFNLIIESLSKTRILSWHRNQDELSFLKVFPQYFYQF